MPEASSRVLLDRTTIRLDGRPFFTFGPRLRVMPQARLGEALEDIAAAGFTAVASPPASLGTIPYLEELFEQAEQRNLLVVLIADPRIPEPSTFLARHFKHRRALHSYCLPIRPENGKSLAWFCRERDRIRSQDLFHPIWTPWADGFSMPEWARATDLQSVGVGLGGPLVRTSAEDGMATVREVLQHCMETKMPGRPFFCDRLEVFPSDRARACGAFDSDPRVRETPDNADEWHPWFAELPEASRLDKLPPDPEVVRLRVYEALARRSRGILADCYEFLCGEEPFTGRDRFHELALLGQEIAVGYDFFAEGQLVHTEVEVGHPRLRVAMIQHSGDYLILVWRSGQGEEFWIDPMHIHRVEISIAMADDAPVDAWQVDFPRARPVRIARNRSGAIRLQLDAVDLTARILLTRSRERPQSVGNSIENRLAAALRHRHASLIGRAAKIDYIERELPKAAGGATRRDDRAARSLELLTEAEHLMESQAHAEAWELCSEGAQLMRRLINSRMVEALSAVELDPTSPIDVLRHSYYLLPQFYREASLRDERVIQEYT